MTGRFISADGVVPNPGAPMNLNRYAYVYNNPLNHIDPTGHAVDYGTGGWEVIDEWRIPEQYSDWYSGEYSGCFMCHAAVANNQTILTNDELAAVDYQMRRAGFDAFENAVRAIDPIDYLATAIECAGGGCDPNAIFFAMMPGISGGLADDFAGLVSARDIRWTQDSINWHTKAGVDLDMLAGDIGSSGFRGSINVVEIEGVLYSLDNRRLTAAKMLGIDVPVNRLDINDPGVLKEFNRKFTTDTNGLSIVIRGPNIRVDASGNIIE